MPTIGDWHPKQLGSCNIECLILNCEKRALPNDFQKKKLSEPQNVGCIQ